MDYKRIISIIVTLIMITTVLSITPIISNAKTIVAPSSVKLESKAAAFTVKFKKSKSKVSGYKIKYSLKKSFKSSKTIKISASKSSKTFKHLKQGKRYYVKVCAYKGSANSKWTKVRSVVTKLTATSMKKKVIKGYWVQSSYQSTTYSIHRFYKDGTVNIKKIYIDTSKNNKVIENNNMWISYSVGTSITKLNYSQYIITWKYNSLKNILYRHYNEVSGPQAGESGTIKMKWYSSYPSTSQLLKNR